MQSRGLRRYRRIAHHCRTHELTELKGIMSLVCEWAKSQEVVRWVLTQKMHHEKHERLAKAGKHVSILEKPN